jgi:hypothetical protein
VRSARSTDIRGRTRCPRSVAGTLSAVDVKNRAGDERRLLTVNHSVDDVAHLAAPAQGSFDQVRFVNHASRLAASNADEDASVQPVEISDRRLDLG